MKASFIPYILHFKTPAGTSRGVLLQKKSYFIVLEQEGIYGIGECSTLPGLSIDHRNDYEKILAWVCEMINSCDTLKLSDIEEFPSIQFGVETALLDLQNGNRILFPSDFTNGKKGILINGLIWMGSRDYFMQQIKDKLDAGFQSIKLKIGSLDFQTELDILTDIRKSFSNHNLQIRLDANGAFTPSNALERLKQLSNFKIHSIEQPIMPKQWEIMSSLIENSPIPIALDEELIGVSDSPGMKLLIDTLKPSYLILKPSLIGGFKKAEEWIKLTNNTSTKWWVTSALESNIGLNAIAQWTYTLSQSLPQGLGTGQLYTNNIPSPLSVKGEYLYYQSHLSWDTSCIIK